MIRTVRFHAVAALLCACLLRAEPSDAPASPNQFV